VNRRQGVSTIGGLNTPPTSTPPVAQALDLRFAYPQCPLWESLSFDLPAGVSLLRGGDGRGKTTLMRLLAADLTPQSGHLRIGNADSRQQAQAYRDQLFWIDPRSTAFDDITVDAFFELMRQRHPRFGSAEMLDELVDGLFLTEHRHKPLYMLSTGSKRKVWMAAGFVSGAALTLIDEPLAALDKPSIAFVLELLAEAAEHPSRAFVVAHYDVLPQVELAAVVDLGD